jgi:acyl-CoA synthetase (AMP-forming)/AMP-acid ligase II
MKLLSLLVDGANPAMVTDTRTYSSAEVRAAVADRVHALHCEGVTRGQRLLVLHDHDAEAIFLLAAASASGLRLVMPYSLSETTAREWVAMVSAAHPDHIVDLRAAVGDSVELKALASNVITREDLTRHAPAPHHELLIVEAPDPIAEFLMLFTSGTTGKPKAIVVSEALVCQRILSVSARLGFDCEARVFMTGLLNNTTGIIFSFGGFAFGATLFLPHGRDIGTWPGQVSAQRLTHMMMRPAALRSFLTAAHNTDLTSLRVVAYGAAAMPRPLLEAARARMPCDWIQGYGLSETFGPFCWMTEEDHRAGLHRSYVHCVGRPDDTVQLRIDAASAGQIGEVLLRRNSLMSSSLDPVTGRSVDVGAWFRTGDLGLFTPEGILVLKGRSCHTLLSVNGHRIFPEEVEGALSEVAGVTEALLLALPTDVNLGSPPVGCVHGPVAFEKAEVIKSRVATALAVNLAREKWPSYIFASREPFPRNDNDKIDRRAVSERLADRQLIALLSDCDANQ